MAATVDPGVSAGFFKNQVILIGISSASTSGCCEKKEASGDESLSSCHHERGQTCAFYPQNEDVGREGGTYGTGSDKLSMQGTGEFPRFKSFPLFVAFCGL